MRPSGPVPVYLCRTPVDMRKSINGLSVLVQEQLQLDAFSSALFVFVGRRSEKIKILYWERCGFCLWYKRLEKHRFRWPRQWTAEALSITAEQLNALLDGYDLETPHAQLHYARVA